MQALKGIVIGLGLTIVFVVGVMVWGLYKKSENPNFKMFSMAEHTAPAKAGKPAPAGGLAIAPSPPMPVGMLPSWGTVSLNLPAGCAIADATVQAGLMIVRSAPTGAASVAGCARVTVIEPATGRILGTVSGGS